MHTVRKRNYAILHVAFKSLNTDSKTKRFIPPSIKWYSATTLHADLQRQKVAFPMHTMLCLFLELQYIAFHIWSGVSKYCFPWMLQHMLFKTNWICLKEYLMNEWFCFKNYVWSNVCSFSSFFTLHIMRKHVSFWLTPFI